MELTRLKVAALGLVVTVAVAIAVALMGAQRSPDLVLKIEPSEDQPGVTVYVGGAVRSPGLYTLDYGAHVADALDAAGGPVDAEISAVPMADKLKDGQEIFVPASSSASSAPEGSPSAASGSAPGSTGRVNVNTAGASELQSLPGIGPALSQRIIDYRTRNGPFSTLDDLAGVRGISSRMVEELRELATTGTSS
ncbi:ComEA family DNA-binding protein [Nitrolancea hollandica]|uniref:Helix-hairpin-helix motif protein n=1 Tax=Nitrolancea hollandica Lb TaxID=1129897 RepID=I4EN34_9BACT|nr:ComEA family DNA-binding protein [Nitrolancea hollandica]CCF86097.1 Helix-hairpin-helix motif protein [Nitrolancea hollandica Lb]